MQSLDLIGIGIGPFNLGLASLLSSHPQIVSTFFERKPQFSWHGGLLLEGTTLQVPFFADLVSMADPTHPLSFLNYLHEHDRLYHFYFYEKFMIPRREYDDYCRWAAGRLSSCNFGETVDAVQYDPGARHFVVQTRSDGGIATQYRARNLSIGIGTQPHIPDWARNAGATVFHTADLKLRQPQVGDCKRIVVVGSGQSAAEAVLSLYRALTPQQVARGAQILWVSRSSGFFPMEYSKLGLEYFTPAYMTHFHRLSRDKRQQIVAGQALLYKGISAATIAEIYDLIYERSIGGQPAGLHLVANCAVDAVDAAGLQLTHRDTGERMSVQADAVVLGTGYRHHWPRWFDDLKRTVIATDPDGHAIIGADFCASRRDGGEGRIFIQNAEVVHHGVGSPDLGLAPYRNTVIANALLGHDHYLMPQHSAFQHFGLPHDQPARPSPARRLTQA